MIKIEKEINGNVAVLKLEGWLDTQTTSEFAKEFLVKKDFVFPTEKSIKLFERTYEENSDASKTLFFSLSKLSSSEGILSLKERKTL